MKFSEAKKTIIAQVPVFFILGLILNIYIVNSDSEIANIFSQAFLEHFAIRSIVLIMLLTAILSGLFLIFFGQVNEESVTHKFCYDYMIKPPVELGITLCSVSFSLLASFALVLLFSNPKLATVPGQGLVLMIFFAFFYWILAVLIFKNDVLEDRGLQIIAGLVLVFGSPAVFWIMIPEFLKI